jgi:adenylate cyclase
MSGEASESNQGRRLTGPADGGAGPIRPIDAFVSYASPDASIANSVVDALEKQGLRCWIAPRDVVPGALYADGIARAINGAKVFVLVLSEHAIASPHVGKEIERASSKRRPIIALHTDSAPLTPAFEYFLSESQWIDARPGSIAAAAAKLVQGIRRHLDADAAIEAPIPLAQSTPSRESAIQRPMWLAVGGIAAVLLTLLAYFVADRLRPSKDADIAAVSHKDRAAPGVEADKTITTASAPPAASIGVLAFSDLSAEGNQAYFSDGIAEEILNLLAHVGGLKVASRTSSFQFRRSDLGAPAIAQKLGVRHILEGSVRKAGDTVRITAQLIDAGTDQHEWSQTFDRPLSTANLFAIQDEIAKNIVDHLAPMMGSAADVAGTTARKGDTANEEAYDLYLKGRSLFIARTKDKLPEAARVLKVAVAKDPKFARAWEMLGAVLATEKYWDVGDKGDYQAGSDAIDMALHLDPNLSMAYTVRGEIQTDTAVGRGAVGWEDALGSSSRAVEHDANNATAYLFRGQIYMALGYFDRAIQDYQRTLEIDPAYEICRRHLAMTYTYLGRTDDAFRLIEISLENGYLFNDVVFASAVAARGDRFGALDILARTYQEDPQLIRPLFRALTDPSFGERDRQDAIALVSQAKNTRNFIPSALLILKAYDEIIVDNTDPPIWWVSNDAAWLNSQSRKRAMQYWHLPEYWRKHGFPPQCQALGKSDFECR